jgi:hypothetical protein
MSCRAPASLDVRRSTAMPALRGLVSGPWPLRAYLKRSFVNHQQPRTAFASDSGHSSLAAGTRLYAPYLPFAIPVGIGSVGGKLSFIPRPLVRRGVPEPAIR